MTHPTKPDRRGPLAVSEEDKARAERALGTTLTRARPALVREVAAEFTRIRAAEREACAAYVFARRGYDWGAISREIRDGAAIRSRGEGDANEKG